MDGVPAACEREEGNSALLCSLKEPLRLRLDLPSSFLQLWPESSTSSQVGEEKLQAIDLSKVTEQISGRTEA